MPITLPYGNADLRLEVPAGWSLDWLAPRDVPGAPEPLNLVHQALAAPLAAPNLAEFRGAGSVAISVNDKTRPVPHDLLLPPLLERLAQLGIPETAIRFFIATGTHTPMPPAEWPLVLPGDLSQRYPVESHDCDELDNLVHLGATSRGTPIWINRRYYESDLKIVIGNIEPHHFMGFSGGAKSAAIGLAGRETINRNHALLTHPHAHTAEYETNPMRSEVEEIGDRIGIHYALNLVMNEQRQALAVLFGSPRAVMEHAVPLARSVNQVDSPGGYDLVIASPGGHPKDINFYQSEKALTHAAMLVREGGVLFLAAACPEGPGSAAYVAEMEAAGNFEQVMQRFQQIGFRVGPHKAVQVAIIAARAAIWLCSEMEPGLVRRLGMNPASPGPLALHELADLLPPAARVAVLPAGAITVPRIFSSKG